MCISEEISYSNIELYHPQVDTSIDVIKEKEDFNCKVGEGFWFYDNLEIKEKPLIYERLLSSAKFRVYIWDPYTLKEDAELFKLINKYDDIEVKCLTSFPKNKDNYLKNKKDFVEGLLKIKEEKNIDIELKVYNITGDSKGFHDRYLFIDDDIFFVGSSMATHNTESNSIPSSTSICKIDNDKNKGIIQDMFWKYWCDSESIELN